MYGAEASKRRVADMCKIEKFAINFLISTAELIAKALNAILKIKIASTPSCRTKCCKMNKAEAKLANFSAKAASTTEPDHDAST